MKVCTWDVTIIMNCFIRHASKRKGCSKLRTAVCIHAVIHGLWQSHNAWRSSSRHWSDRWTISTGKAVLCQVPRQQILWFWSWWKTTIKWPTHDCCRVITVLEAVVSTSQRHSSVRDLTIESMSDMVASECYHPYTAARYWHSLKSSSKVWRVSILKIRAFSSKWMSISWLPSRYWYPIKWWMFTGCQFVSCRFRCNILL